MLLEEKRTLLVEKDKSPLQRTRLVYFLVHISFFKSKICIDYHII